MLIRKLFEIIISNLRELKQFGHFMLFNGAQNHHRKSQAFVCFHATVEDLILSLNFSGIWGYQKWPKSTISRRLSRFYPKIKPIQQSWKLFFWGKENVPNRNLAFTANRGCFLAYLSSLREWVIARSRHVLHFRRSLGEHCNLEECEDEKPEESGPFRVGSSNFVLS